MGQRTNGMGGDADFIGHAFDVADRATDHFPRLHRLIPRRLRRDRRIAGVLRDFLNRQAHFVNRRGDHVSHFLLASGAFSGVIHNLGHLAHRRAQAFAGGQHFADHVALTVEEAIEPPRQIAQFIGAAGI
ncbi:hypothetical protein D3C84_776040 [compost metagenome]